MKIGFITLPEVIIPTDGIFFNLVGYWKPPAFVERFWANGAAIQFTDAADYEVKKAQALQSHAQCIRDYYRTFPC